MSDCPRQYEIDILTFDTFNPTLFLTYIKELWDEFSIISIVSIYWKGISVFKSYAKDSIVLKYVKHLISKVKYLLIFPHRYLENINTTYI